MSQDVVTATIHEWLFSAEHHLAEFVNPLTAGAAYIRVFIFY